MTFNRRADFGGGCDKLTEAADLVSSCCSSCHEDDEQGYHDLPQIEFDGKEYSVCCALSNELRDSPEARGSRGGG